MEYDYSKLREYIKRCKWQWATSMIDVPHEYIHRDKCALTMMSSIILSAHREKMESMKDGGSIISLPLH